MPVNRQTIRDAKLLRVVNDIARFSLDNELSRNEIHKTFTKTAKKSHQGR